MRELKDRLLEEFRCPLCEDYDVQIAFEALQGITQAIYSLTTRLPKTESERDHWFASLSNLAWAGMLISGNVEINEL